MGVVYDRWRTGQPRMDGCSYMAEVWEALDVDLTQCMMLCTLCAMLRMHMTEV